MTIEDPRRKMRRRRRGPYPVVLDDWHGSKQASDGVLVLFSELTNDFAPLGLSSGYKGQNEVFDCRQCSPI
jgi:hypothetical protein